MPRSVINPTEHKIRQAESIAIPNFCAPKIARALRPTVGCLSNLPADTPPRNRPWAFRLILIIQ
jgi:hypothetical protein